MLLTDEQTLNEVDVSLALAEGRQDSTTLTGDPATNSCERPDIMVTEVKAWSTGGGDTET